MSTLPARVALDCATTTAAAILHHMHMMPTSLSAATEKCRKLIDHFHSVHETLRPLEDVIPKNVSERETFFVFALLYCMQEIGRQDANCLENCTLVEETCTVLQGCVVCKQYQRHHRKFREESSEPPVFRIMSLAALQPPVRGALRELMLAASQGRDPTKSRKGCEVRFEAQAETRALLAKQRVSRDTTTFIAQVGPCAALMWGMLIAPSFVLLQFHMRVPDTGISMRLALPSSKPKPKRHHVEVAEPPSQPMSPSYAPRSPTITEPDAVYSPESPSYNASGAEQQYSPCYSASPSLRAASPKAVPAALYFTGSVPAKTTVGGWSDSDDDCDIDGNRLNGTVAEVPPGARL